MCDLNKKNKAISVGTKIRNLRIQRGWNQKQMADMLGISIPAISKIETDYTDINLSRLEQIAHIFDISVVELLTTDPEEREAILSPIAIVQRKILIREREISALQEQIIELYKTLKQNLTFTNPDKKVTDYTAY
ncbi:helix-turn-helix domain-containing protein [Mucilaginibacter sp. SP1R1]|uniref:helix-turn-helix domain-containing protein n=1 Tax=Mucilaginibacter sp. SP1R1 TaxID=2723091 RepID=UPI00160A4E82|nr:helix-turn-helix transcriptional regulator [Mucilaginibacter sp. SP1R1]MBB6152728.1 transcriptional regulator with XRE-family HTH domain [Mucilaginibacter sp. SP1R1]